MVRDRFRYLGGIQREETCSNINCIHLRTSKAALLPHSPSKLVHSIAKITEVDYTTTFT